MSANENYFAAGPIQKRNVKSVTQTDIGVVITLSDGSLWIVETMPVAECDGRSNTLLWTKCSIPQTDDDQHPDLPTKSKR